LVSRRIGSLLGGEQLVIHCTTILHHKEVSERLIRKILIPRFSTAMKLLLLLRPRTAVGVFALFGCPARMRGKLENILQANSQRHVFLLLVILLTRTDRFLIKG